MTFENARKKFDSRVVCLQICAFSSFTLILYTYRILFVYIHRQTYKHTSIYCTYKVYVHAHALNECTCTHSQEGK